MLITVTVTTTTLATLMLPKSIADGQTHSGARSLSIQSLENSLHAGQKSFSSIISAATSTSGMYSQSQTAATTSDGTAKLITNTTQWTNSKGALELLTTKASISDFFHASLQSCGSTLVGNWKSPKVSSFSMTPGNLLPSTFPRTPYPIHALTINGNTLVASVPLTLNHSDANLFTFDISSTTHPVYVDSLNTSSTTNTRLTSLASVGSYIYGGNGNPASYATCAAGPACSQLQVFFMTGSHLQTAVNFKLASSTPPYISITINGQGSGRAVYLQNNLLYVGLQKMPLPPSMEFNIINVQDPLKPVWLGGYSVGRTINQIRVSNGFAYLATDDPNKELLVLDVHDPAHPTYATSYNAPGNAAFGFGESVYLSGTAVALGRSYVTDGPEILLFSTATSSLPVFLGPSTSSSTPASIQSILFKGFLLFVATATQLQIFDMRDPSSLVPYTTPVTFPNSSTASSSASMVCSNNTLYLATSDSSQNGYLITVTGS